MINTFAMQSRGNGLPSSVKMHMRMDERSGLYVVNKVNNTQYNPSSVGIDGSLAFGTANAVTITNNSDNISTPINWDVTLNTSKVCLLASSIKMNSAGGTRVAMGSASSTNVFTASCVGASGLHGYFCNAALTDGPQIAQTAGFGFSNNTSTFIHYALWDGVNTFTVKVIDTNGVVHNNGTNDLVRSTTATFTATSMTLGNEARLTNGHYFGITCWELQKVPRNLDLKLAQWAASLTSGNKGALDLT